MTAILWPRQELPARNFRLDPAWRNLRGPASAEGFSQVASSDAGIWVGTLTDIPVHQQSGHMRIELWHAINGLLEGRLGSVMMPVYVSGRRPLPDGVTDQMIDHEPRIPHSDDSLFDDDTGYENLWIDTELAAGANRRAVELTIAKNVCGDIRPGMRFSLDPMDYEQRPIRLYQVKRVVSQDEETAVIRINFPLREALPAGQRLEWARPYVQMRLASDGEMDILLTPADLTQFPSVNFLEDL